MNSIEMMAYSFGAILGDGTMGVYKIRRGFTFKVAVRCGDPEPPHLVCEEVNDMFETDYKVSVTYPNSKPFYNVKFGRKDIYNFFEEYTNHKQYVPAQILYGEDNAKRLLLAGLLDADGYVDKWNNCVCFTNTNYELVESVVQMFKYFGMHIYGPYVNKQVGKRGEAHGREIYGRKDCFIVKTRAEDFVRAGCMFLVQRKQESLIKGVEGYVRRERRVRRV
jgi:hypothetical protein